jgi:hypothetical protein
MAKPGRAKGTEMVRVFVGAGGCARLAGKRLLPFGLVAAWVLLSVAGCKGEPVNVDVDNDITLTPWTDKNNDKKGATRSQKPENDTASRSKTGSLLDQVSYPAPVASEGEVAARIRASVNGTAILDDELREAVYPQLLALRSLPEPLRSEQQKKILEQELQHLIEREVILQDALARLKDRPQVVEKLKEAAGKDFDKKMQLLRKSSNLKSDEEFKAFLRAQGLTLAGVKRQVERNFMAMEYMRNRVVSAIDRVGHQEITDYYEAHPEEFQIADSVTWQDIFIDASQFRTRDEARALVENIIAQARNGADFLKLVNQHDKGDSSYRNGEGYGHRRGEIKPPQAETTLFQMHDGDVSLVELTNGFHVIRLVKRQYAGRQPLDAKTQTAIRNKLQNMVWDQEYKRILADLKRKATIEISTAAQ